MIVRRITLALLSALLLSLVAGCATQGSRQPATGLLGPSTDMIDNTGQFGRTARKGAGDIYVKLAVGYMREGRLDVALQKARTAIEVDSINADAHNIIALLYSRLAEQGLAERHFKRSLKLAPRNSYTLNAYGTFLCQQKRYEEADQQFNHALSNPLYSTPEMTLTNAGICAKRKLDIQQAERYFRRALIKQPTLSNALLQMAIISFEHGKHLSSRGYLQRYRAVAKPTAGSLWLGIRNERILGDQDAVASYRLLLKNSFPDAPETQLMRESEKQ